MLAFKAFAFVKKGIEDLLDVSGVYAVGNVATLLVEAW